MGRRYSVAFSCIIEPCSAKPGKVEDTYNHGFRSAILTEADSAYSLICYVSILEVANLSYNVIVDDWSGMPYPTVDEALPVETVVRSVPALMRE